MIRRPPRSTRTDTLFPTRRSSDLSPIGYSPTGETFNLRAEELATAVAIAMGADKLMRSEEHTSELQSLMRISYAVFCLKKKKTTTQKHADTRTHYHCTSILLKSLIIKQQRQHTTHTTSHLY